MLKPPRRIDLGDALLRPWSTSDHDALHAALVQSEAHLRAWTPWVVDGKVPGQTLAERLAQHAAKFDAGTEWVYGVLSLNETAVLGGAGLYPRVGPRAVEIGYWLAAGHMGRGLATRAAAALTDAAFASPDIDHVEIRCERANVASGRVPERLGYRRDDAASAAAGLDVWRMDRDGVRRWPPAG